MQRWGLPWEHIETHWTNSQYYMLAAAIKKKPSGGTAKNVFQRHGVGLES